MRLRDYQKLAVRGILDAWQDSTSTLTVLATGLGKTVIAAHVINQFPGRCLFLAHREELIWQAQRAIKAVTGVEPGVEMADYKTDAGFWGKPRVIVSTVQTQYSGRMEKFNPDEFDLLVTDEAHHYVSPSYEKVINYYRRNPRLKVLGITATPDRADEMALGRIFESVAFNFGIKEGIDEGWLVPVEQQTVVVEDLDLSNCRTTAGDLNGADLAEVLEKEECLHEISVPTLELAGSRKTLLFCASVAHAERLAEILNRHKPGSARWVCGETPKEERRQLFSDYASNRFQFLCNVGVATEGFDDPGVEIVVMARPTKSRCLYTQMVGRGTRPLRGVVDPYDSADDRRMAIAESAKPSMLVVDLVGNAGKHKLVCTADVLGGDYDDEVVERAKKASREAAGPVDMTEALARAMEEIRREKEREAARRARLTATGKFSSRRIDPFDVLHIEPRREMGWDKGRELSEKQRGLIEKHYGLNPADLPYVQAKQLLDELFRRWDKGECSVKQANILHRHGLPTNVHRDQAKEWIDKIAGNRWQLPPELEKHSTRQPVEVF